MKQTVESAQLLRSSSASPSGAIVVALGRVFLMASSFSGWVLIGYVVHLLVTAAVTSGVWLRRLGLGSAGLWGVLRLPLRFNLSLMQLFGPGILLEKLVQLLEIFGWVPDAVTIHDASPKAADGVMDRDVVVDR
jgi:hypothetical protein